VNRAIIQQEIDAAVERIAILRADLRLLQAFVKLKRDELAGDAARVGDERRLMMRGDVKTRPICLGEVKRKERRGAKAA